MLSVVYPDSPSREAGLRPGDVITSFGGSKVNSCRDLEQIVAQAVPGTAYRVEFYRGEEFFYVRLTAGHRAPAPPGGYGQIVDIGLLGDAAGSPIAREMGIGAAAGMAVAEVTPGKAAAQAGLRRGDLIVRFGSHDIANFEDYQAAMLRSPIGSQVQVGFVRGDQRQETVLTATGAPRGDVPRWYTHPRGAFRILLPPSWYVFPKDRPGEPSENQYDWVISVRGAYHLKLFKESWDAPEAEAALQQFLRFWLKRHSNGVAGRSKVAAAPAAWVAVHLPAERFMLYRISFVHQGRRYVVNALAPVLSDPERLPGPIDWVLQSIEFQAMEVAGGNQPPGREPSEPSAEPEPSATVPAGWITKTVVDVTVSVPPDWTASEFSAEDEGLWYQGDPLRPEVSFSLLRDTPFAELSRGGAVKDKSATTIGGAAAERFVVDAARPDRPEKGIVVVFQRRKGLSSSTALACFAAAGKWDQYEKTFQQILACVRVGGQ